MIWAQLFIGLALADEFSHTYEVDETVRVWFNQVAVTSRPYKTHAFSWLPLCHSALPPKDTQTLSVGEVIEGFALQDSGMEVRFLQEVNERPLCSVQLSPEESQRLGKAVQDKFSLQLFVDNLPTWGPLGKATATGEVSVYTHFRLLISHNDNQITEVHYKPENLVKLESTMDFTYSVTWLPTSTPFAARLRLSEDPFFHILAHSMIAFSITMLMIGPIAVIRLIVGRLILHNEFLESAPPVTNTSGTLGHDLAAFKQLAGEVFRPPGYLVLFTVCISGGTHLLAITLALLLLFLLCPVYMERTHRGPVLVLVYSLLALLGGLRSGSYYQQQGGRYWLTTLFLSLLSIPLLVTAMVLTIQPLLGESEAQVFLLLGVPLHLVGATLGRKYSTPFSRPCKSSPQQCIRYQKRWFQHSLILIVLTGFVPFLIIQVTANDLLNNVLEYRYFCMYGFSLAYFLSLIGTCAGLAVLVTYYLITIEDHRWPWVSFLSAGSFSGYLFWLYADLYASKPRISGWIPYFTYFGYIGFACFGLFLLLGASGHFAAQCFMQYVYTHLKRL